MNRHEFSAGDETVISKAPTTIIQPTRGWAPIRLRDLLEFRELLYFLVWGELKVRYKQTAFGVAWAVFQPVAVMTVFTVFYSWVIRFPTGETPYPLFAYSGLLVWIYFSNALNQSSNSLVRHERLITKVYFPRLLVPIAAVLAGLVDLAIGFVVLVVLLAFYGFSPTVALLTLPLFVLLAVTIALTISLWLSALNVRYRDIKLLVPVLIQLWFFSTPIIYPSSLIPASWRGLYQALNPMAGVVEGFRWALLGETEPPNPLMAVSVAIILVLLVGGLYYFRRMERTFADVV